MNGDICILEFITDIQNTGSGSMNIRDSNVDSEGISMNHCTVGLIKPNSLNMRTPICTVVCNKFPCIRKVTFLITLINNLTGDLCYISEEFYCYVIQKKADILVLSILYK